VRHRCRERAIAIARGFNVQCVDGVFFIEGQREEVPSLMSRL
jgi:hypothetical protein